MTASLTLAAPAAFAPAVRALAERYGRQSGRSVETLFGPAAGEAPASIVSRLQSDTPPDLVLLPAIQIDRMIEAGKLVPAGRSKVANSPIALCVRDGAPRPETGTSEALRQTLRGAQSIGVSALASGVFFREKLLTRLGLADEVGPRCRIITDRPIGEAVALGEVEMGVQQHAELMQEAGIDILDPLPEDLQGATLLCAAASAASSEATAFLIFLTGPEAAECLRANGLLPDSASAR